MRAALGFRFLTAYLRARRVDGLEDRAKLEAIQRRWLGRLRSDVVRTSAFYRPYEGRDWSDWPIVDKSAWMRGFDSINTVGARLEEVSAIAMRADVTDENDVAAMVGRAVDEFGHVDILCNNAAAPGQDRWIWEQTVDNWNATIAIDVTAAMLCTREVLNRSMLQRRSGVILNFSSTIGYSGMVRKTHYVTAKASLRAFTKAVALEVGPHGIRCNCIVPGAIDTELWRNWVQRTADEQGVDAEMFRAKQLKGVALQDISSPEDIANLALFLASDESRTITGQSIPVDAGGYMQG